MSTTLVLTHDMTRWMSAAFVSLGWAMLWLPLWRRRPKRSQTASEAPPRFLVCHASQSGNAEQLAHQAAERLQQVDPNLQLLPLGKLTAKRLQHVERLVLIVSTYGEGEPPDSALAFASSVLGQDIALNELKFLLLALGDSHYRQFCGFANRLESWLTAQGAKPLAPSIRADRLDPASLNAWQDQLTHIGAAPADQQQESRWHSWRVIDRECLNPHSKSAPAYLIRLEPTTSGLTWQPGDIAQLQPIISPDHTEPAVFRDYSIANLPGSRNMELLVRLVRYPDGRTGRVSGWLCEEAEIGSALGLSIRSNPNFHLASGDAPLILIGAGTGLAGLRGHLLQRVAQGRYANWLIYGERHPVNDQLLGEELDALHASGELRRLDWCFSRAAGQPEYVQDRLASQGEDLRTWLDNGATIMVCGSLQDMGRSVDIMLRELFGEQRMRDLQRAGRYLRDLY